ncbi:MAG: hypothetical protein WBP56_18490 [Polyangia bacterium]
MKKPVRLILAAALFDSDRRVGRLNAVLDRIHDKFGSAAVTTADLHAAPGRKRE